ncbi:MAG TPA: CHAT domain-containing tetratricopeptide repeat protein [Thermoanaerobaculia bacterium]
MFRGQVQEERHELPANHFVTLDVVPYDVELDARILDPDGTEILRAALEYDTRVSFITGDAGPYRLVLTATPDSSQLGSVHIEMLDSHPVTPRDARQLDAQRALYDGVMLLRSQKAQDAVTALPLLERAHKAWADLGDCTGEMRALYAIGVAHATKDDLETSARDLRLALVLARERNDIRTIAGALRNIAAVSGKVDRDGARVALREAVLLSRHLASPAAEARAYYHLGNVELAANEQRLAITLYEAGQAAMRLAGNPYVEALIANGTAVALGNLGDWRAAIVHLERAVPLFRAAGDKRMIAVTMQNLGSAYGLLGNHQDALEQFGRALPLAREMGDRATETTNFINSGASLTELGRLAEARASLMEGLALARAAEDTRVEAMALRHLGRIEDREKRHAEALAYHQQSLRLQQSGGNRRGEAFALLNIGTLHRKLGNAVAARRALRESHALACTLEDQGLDSATRLALARVEAGEGELDAAWGQLEAAIHGVESLRVNVAGAHLRSTYQLTIREYYELAVDVLMRMKRPAEALEVSERARARGLLDLLAEAQVDVRQGGDPELLAQERKLRRAINDVAALYGRSQKKKELAAEIDALAFELRQVERRIRQASPRYASLMQAETLTLREIQRDVLDDDTLLLEISLGADRGHIWAVSNDAVAVRELPARKEVEAVARRFYDAVTARNTSVENETPRAHLARLERAKQRIDKNGARLSELLLARLPLRGKSRLLIVAEGALQYVPFAALPFKGEPLVTGFELVHMPSVSALAALRRETNGRRTPERSVAVLADPLFGKQMPRLPMAREEAASIARIAHRPEVRLGAEATRAAAMSGELRRFRYVHFATHGVLDDKHPELSGIALSDGFLRLHDIYNLELPADLVVLSACQTALGKDVAHEGMIGLTRGFMYAGAERVLASLWKIDDRATAELMRGFYQRMLVERMTPAAALRAVQLEMARSPRWSEPYHWAAFTLQGEWRP